MAEDPQGPIDDTDFERLAGIDDFKALTPIQKQILFLHVKSPELTKAQLAKNLGITVQAVTRLFFSQKFEKINEEFARQEKREILQLAIKTMRECLNSESPAIRFQAASRILDDAGVMRKEVKPLKQDNNFFLIWGKKDRPQPEGKIIDAADSNSLLTAPEAA